MNHIINIILYLLVACVCAIIIIVGFVSVGWYVYNLTIYFFGYYRRLKYRQRKKNDLKQMEEYIFPGMERNNEKGFAMETRSRYKKKMEDKLAEKIRKEKEGLFYRGSV